MSGLKIHSTRFPFISLRKALMRAEVLYTAGRGAEVLVSDAFKLWEYSGKSSGGFQTVAALKMYGLVSDSGSQDKRKLALTDQASRYFRDEREEERIKLVKEFAVKPTMLLFLWNQWASEPPDDTIARSYLKVDVGLNDQAARSVLGIFKENIRFADLKGFAKTEGEIENGQGANGGDFKVGDYVQWESQGQQQWKVPWKVVAIDAYEDGQKYFKVESVGDDAGQTGWIRMAEAIRPEDSGTGAGKRFPPPPPPRGSNLIDDAVPEGWHEERLIDDGGEEIFIKYEGRPSVERYRFIRDYLDFKIDRLQPEGGKKEKMAE